MKQLKNSESNIMVNTQTTAECKCKKNVPLTDEQINLLINGRGDEDDDDYVEPTGDGFGLTDEDLVKLVRRVEASHGITAAPEK